MLVQSNLSNRNRSAVVDNLEGRGELKRLYRVLAAHGMRFVPIKGTDLYRTTAAVDRIMFLRNNFCLF